MKIFKRVFFCIAIFLLILITIQTLYTEYYNYKLNRRSYNSEFYLIFNGIICFFSVFSLFFNIQKFGLYLKINSLFYKILRIGDFLLALSISIFIVFIMNIELSLSKILSEVIITGITLSLCYLLFSDNLKYHKEQIEKEALFKVQFINEIGL